MIAQSAAKKQVARLSCLPYAPDTSEGMTEIIATLAQCSADLAHGTRIVDEILSQCRDRWPQPATIREIALSTTPDAAPQVIRQCPASRLPHQRDAVTGEPVPHPDACIEGWVTRYELGTQIELADGRRWWRYERITAEVYRNLTSRPDALAATGQRVYSGVMPCICRGGR